MQAGVTPPPGSAVKDQDLPRSISSVLCRTIWKPEHVCMCLVLYATWYREYCKRAGGRRPGILSAQHIRMARHGKGPGAPLHELRTIRLFSRQRPKYRQGRTPSDILQLANLGVGHHRMQRRNQHTTTATTATTTTWHGIHWIPRWVRGRGWDRDRHDNNRAVTWAAPTAPQRRIGPL